MGIVTQKDILRADVTMNDVHRLAIRIFLVVRVIKTLADLAHNKTYHPYVKLAPRPDTSVKYHPKILSRDVFQRDVVLVIDIAEVKYLRNVRMRQLAGDLRLVDEHRDELFVLSDRRKNLLHCDDTFKAFNAERLRLIYLSHPAGIQLLEQKIITEWDGFRQYAHGFPTF